MPVYAIVLIVVAVLLIGLFFGLGYLKAPPDTAYIISGPFRRKI